MSYTYKTREPIVTQTQNIRAKFEVEEIGEYTRVRRVGKRADDGVTKGLLFTDEKVVIPRAWIVYFPSGHSIRVESEEEMYRLGYMEPPPMVDMETGEEVPNSSLPLTPKQIVQQNTRRARSTL